MSSLSDMVSALHGPACSIAGAPISWAELIGDLSGTLCVWLIARQSVLNWPLGLVNNVFWCLLFWNTKLYADASLQVCFFALGVYGWYTWTRGMPTRGGALPVRHTSAREWLWLAGLSGLGSATLAGILMYRTDSPAPLWDATILTLSLAASYGQTQKLLESWWLWIAVDVVSVPLCLSRALYPTALVYVLFGCMCVRGLRNWRASLRAQSADLTSR